eukprot:2333544-Karenia_brevis.AAC.1
MSGGALNSQSHVDYHADFHTGSRVQIFGLIAKPELNGMYGMVMAIDPSTQVDKRFPNKLDDGREVGVKGENLNFAAPAMFAWPPAM